MGLDQVISVDGMVLGGARRIRYAVQNRVETTCKQLQRFLRKVLPVLLLGYFTYAADQAEVKSEILIRRKEFVTDFFF